MTHGLQFAHRLDAADSPNVDAFGRSRVSNPYILFESKHIAQKNDYAWYERITGAIVPAGAGQVGSTESVSAELINQHCYISQDVESTNSQAIVIFATARTGTANITAHISVIELE